MNPGSILIGLAFMIVTIPWVIAPILKKETGRRDAKDSGPALESDQHTQGLIALRDLEFDHSTGKVSEEDYATLRANLFAQIATSLEAKEKRKALLDAKIEEKISTYRHNKLVSLICGQCGKAIDPSDHFCRACGAAVDSACPKCGGILKASDRFCSICGAPVTIQEEGPSPALKNKESAQRN